MALPVYYFHSYISHHHYECEAVCMTYEINESYKYMQINSLEIKNTKNRWKHMKVDNWNIDFILSWN